MESITKLHHRADTTQVEAEALTELLFAVFVTAAFIGTYQTVVFNVLQTAFWKQYEYSQNRKAFRKVAYQITNLTVNAILGIYGLYIFHSSVPPLHTVPIHERISGFDEYALFGALQVGYNLWALPIGYFFMNETQAMMAHHLAVLCVGSISSFATNGFRYHAPFFFGVIEISSVPLAIMNFCKDQEEITKAYCPKLPLVVRPVFAVVFLMVRVVLWTPLIGDVLRLAGLLGMTCETGVCMVGIGSFALSAVFLTLLQFYWALLIVKGIRNALKGEDRSGSQKTKRP